MLHGSVWPARRAEKTMAEPSGREGELALVAERLGGGVAVEAVGDPDRIARAVGVDHEQVVLGAVGPGVPVAHEHAVIDLTGRLAVAGLRAARDGAGQVVAARIDGQRHRDLGGVGAEAIGVHVQRQVGDLGRRGAGRCRSSRPGSCPNGPRGNRGCRPNPSGRCWRRRRRWPGGGPAPSPFEVLDHQAGDAAIGGHVRGADGVDDLGPVRRHARVRQPVGVQHVGVGEGALGRLGGAASVAGGASARAGRAVSMARAAQAVSRER